MAEAIIEDPNNVTFTTTKMYVDNLEIIEFVTNSSDYELENYGYSESDIKETRDQIKIIQDASCEELVSNYNIPMSEARMIKMSATPSSEYEAPKTSDDVFTTSSSISQSELTFTLGVTSSSTSTKPIYNGTILFSWNTPYFMTIFKDRIGLAWGGGSLNITDIKSNVDYYSVSGVAGAFKYNNFYTSKSWSYNETPNTGVEFYTPQSITNVTDIKIKSGKITFVLSQTKKEGKYTNIIAQYGHNVYQVVGSDLSLAGGTVTFSSGYDVSPSRSVTVMY